MYDSPISISGEIDKRQETLTPPPRTPMPTATA